MAITYTDYETALEKQLALNKVTGAELSAAIAPPVGPILGTAYVIAKDALAIVAAAQATANIRKMQRGGVAKVGAGVIAEGPSHARGEIPLPHRGRPAGVEIEGGEPVPVANVSKSPLLLTLASVVNQLAGGRALTSGLSSSRMA